MSDDWKGFDDGLESRSAAEERRATARFSSHLTTQIYSPSVGGPAEKVAVRDVSKYGLGLVLHRKLENGTQLIVDLESATDGNVHSVLCRVVHAQQLDADNWLTGCALVDEKDDRSLKIFDAWQKPSVPGDGRAWVRFPCNIETFCQTVETSPGEQIPARVINVSAGGVGLLIPCQFETRTLMRMQLPGPFGQTPPRVLVRVVRSQPHSAGHWYLGCEFVDCLKEDEVERVRS